VASLHLVAEVLTAASAARTVPDGVSFPQGLTERWTFMVALIVVAAFAAQVVRGRLRLRHPRSRVVSES
jgi:hypothetical protein